MRFRSTALIALFSFAAFALPSRYSYEWAANSTAQPCSAGSCTRAAPTLPTEGMSLVGMFGYKLTVCAAAGQTLSGAGSLLAWDYNVDEGVWTRDPLLDLAVTVSGGRCQTWPDFPLGAGVDRVLFAASGVTVSGGTGLDVLLSGEAVR
jgi:hypothetical protein